MRVRVRVCVIEEEVQRLQRSLGLGCLVSALVGFRIGLV